MKHFSEDNSIEIKYIYKDLNGLKDTISNNQNTIESTISRIESLEQQGSSTGTSPDNFGTKYYTKQDFTALLNDFETETFFGNRSIAKIPVCLELADSPKTQLLFRINPLFTQKPHLALGFWFSNISGSMPETFTFSISLNGTIVIDESVLTISNKKAFIEFDIDPVSCPLAMFNSLNITFNESNSVFVDWIELEVSNAHNPIVLNRNTDYEIYGLRNGKGGHRILSSKFLENGRWGYIGGDDPSLENDTISSGEYGALMVQQSRIKWATRMPQQNFDAFISYTVNVYLEYFINQKNRFFAKTSTKPMSTLYDTTEYIENVRYAKKSLHNGKDEDIECACLAFTDFSVGMLHTHHNASRPANFFTPLAFQFNGEDYPQEFVDFIPVYDHNRLGQKTQKVSCGYFLHHKSGNILFVPQTQSNYFIKIGKGRQVHAYLSQDNLKILVFFQVGNNVVQKTLLRETEEAEWELTNQIKYHLNFEEVVPFQEFYYTIKNRDIQKSEGILM